jgi:hypothetical protein
MKTKTTQKQFVSDDLFCHLMDLLVEKGLTEEEALNDLKRLGVETTPL